MAESDSRGKPRQRRIRASGNVAGRNESLRVGFRRERHCARERKSVEAGRPEVSRETRRPKTEVTPKPEARQSYFITPRCAIPILSRVEFLTMYIIPSAWRIRSWAVRASCG